MNLVNQARDFGLILDGAMSTALEKQGVNTNNDLWTAVALENNLDKVYKVHMNYFKSGAQMTITNTYQANVQAFKKHGYNDEHTKKLITDAVQIAKKLVMIIKRKLVSIIGLLHLLAHMVHILVMGMNFVEIIH